VPFLLWKNPIFFGFTFMALIALQVGLSYYSIDFFLDGELLLGFLFFIFVPVLALLVGFYYIWFRRQRINSTKG